MALLDIIEAPHPTLSKRAREAREDEFGPELERLCADMAETMYAAPGVGLAAPQVGDGRRVLVFDPGEYEDADGNAQKADLRTVVNPEIVEREGMLVWEESCLSVPDFFVDVKRFQRVKVRWRDPSGGEHEEWIADFPAIVIQHEMDHLDGVTLLEKASRLKRGRYLSRRRKAAKAKARALA